MPSFASLAADIPCHDMVLRIRVYLMCLGLQRRDYPYGAGEVWRRNNQLHALQVCYPTVKGIAR